MLFFLNLHFLCRASGACLWSRWALKNLFVDTSARENIRPQADTNGKFDF